MLKCPKCGSNRVDQYRKLTGAIWCNCCNFRAEEKEKYNPFKVDELVKKYIIMEEHNIESDDYCRGKDVLVMRDDAYYDNEYDNIEDVEGLKHNEYIMEVWVKNND